MKYFKVWFYYTHDMEGEMICAIYNEDDIGVFMDSTMDRGIEVVSVDNVSEIEYTSMYCI